MNTLAQRLKYARELANLSQQEVAKRAGISQPTYFKIENGSTLKPRNILEISHALNVDAHWLATGEGEMDTLPHQVQFMLDLDNTSQPISTAQIDPNSKIWLPLMDISFSYGDGVSIDCHFEDTKKKLAFEPDFLTSRHIKQENVRLLYATGDSMEEFIYDGDVFAIDVSDTMVRDGQIYAVYFEGEAMLKQIFKEAGGKLILHSKNPKYRDKEVTEDNGADFRVIGRQFWRAG
ncbi:helix-turn-helix transcriptional regulator [Moraxella sp. VT-16-12]|uniref:XRE family transcriptional regulator n=1 Tax=Moraxella sp. VT-16-12 TaxID=2014877 RepID=UPI000B7E60C3|nr:helix-turn-helix transcriptional regulator [Moraxella sp. VT-16-12]TWV80439.1 helix-turn-helix transcriptional regulator [Moraxella sp. VT-16-12]